MRTTAPVIVFLIAASLGAMITFFVYRNEEIAALARFEVLADDVADALGTRVREHITLLVATASFIAATPGDVDRTAFRRFVSGLDLKAKFSGIQGIGQAIVVKPGEEAVVSARISDNYAMPVALWPESGLAIRTAIVLLEPLDQRNRAALGYDMYSEQRRRDAITRAMGTGKIAATAPVTLVQEITSEKQAGFLVYLPQTDPGESVTGFIYAPFRAGDLHDAILSEQKVPVEVRTLDKDALEENELYISTGYDVDATGTDMEVAREIEVAGRTWVVSIQRKIAASYLDHAPFTIITGLITFLLATAIAAALWWQLQSLERAKAIKMMSEKTLQEKDLLLQEMKHRIKNSIARILAIARQTAASSDTIEAFSESFGARLQSMANAQDLLTRSHWEGADLRALLSTELQQVLGKEPEKERVSGPPVKLDGKQTQALGLTFHELATNALKYGAGADLGGDLEISWRIEDLKGRKKTLVLLWRETAKREEARPERRGFGGKLVDVSIEGELSGKIERVFHDEGLDITIRFPLSTNTS